LRCFLEKCRSLLVATVNDKYSFHFV
jgi:hypothetical protein